jgi:outer membrane protein, adhesin transport system
VDFRVRQTWGSNIDNSGGSSRDTVAEVVMNYNLYRGGADQAREKQAVEFNLQARDLQEKACRDVRQTLAIAYNDVVRLNEQLGYLDQHRLSTEVAREAYRQQFDIGQRTLLDVLDTQNEYFEASRAYLNGQYNEFIAQARTLASMGKLTAIAGGESRPTADAGRRGSGPWQAAARRAVPLRTPPAVVTRKRRGQRPGARQARPRHLPGSPAPGSRKSRPRSPSRPTCCLTSTSRCSSPKAQEARRAGGIPQDPGPGGGWCRGPHRCGGCRWLQRSLVAAPGECGEGLPGQPGRGRRKNQGPKVAASANPLPPTTPAEGRAQNRRVEITVVETAK